MIVTGEQCSPPPDIISGGKAIAEFLGMSEGEVYRAVAHATACPHDPNRIPVFKIPGTKAIRAHRDSLTRWLRRLEKHGVAKEAAAS